MVTASVPNYFTNHILLEKQNFDYDEIFLGKTARTKIPNLNEIKKVFLLITML